MINPQFKVVSIGNPGHHGSNDKPLKRLNSSICQFENELSDCLLVFGSAEKQKLGADSSQNININEIFCLTNGR